MTIFRFFGKRYIFGIRMLSMFLAVLLFLGALQTPVRAVTISESYLLSSSQPVSESTAASDTDFTTVSDPDADTSEIRTGESSVISQLDITARAAIIVGTGRGTSLYFNAPDVPYNIPAASKLMTAVIALEALPLDTQVTISSDAQAMDELSDEPLFLSKGEKCSVKYLVTAILYTDSDAAAFSLAEYISSDERFFVERMNEMAKALDMSTTLFANTSGKPVVPNFSSSVSTTLYSSYAKQYTTLSDLSSLFRYALNVEGFRELFTKYKTLMFLSDGTPQTLTNSMSAAWGLNPQLKGASRFACGDSVSTSCILALASVDDFEIAILLAGSHDDSIYQDLYMSINTVFSSYEVTDLVVAGDAYTKVSIEGIPEPLIAVFKSTVRYIHPTGNDYIKANAVFIPDESVTLPISAGQSLGHVRFELLDGTQIDTEVVAAQGMWTKSTFLSDTIALLVANRNLSIIIGIAVFLFLVSVIRSVYILINQQIRSQRRKRNSSGK